MGSVEVLKGENKGKSKDKRGGRSGRGGTQRKTKANTGILRLRPAGFAQDDGLEGVGRWNHGS